MTFSLFVSSQIEKFIWIPGLRLHYLILKWPLISDLPRSCCFRFFKWISRVTNIDYLFGQLMNLIKSLLISCNQLLLIIISNLIIYSFSFDSSIAWTGRIDLGTWITCTGYKNQSSIWSFLFDILVLFYGYRWEFSMSLFFCWKLCHWPFKRIWTMQGDRNWIELS
jgi:hypothetical protein